MFYATTTPFTSTGSDCNTACKFLEGSDQTIANRAGQAREAANFTRYNGQAGDLHTTAVPPGVPSGYTPPGCPTYSGSYGARGASIGTGRCNTLAITAQNSDVRTGINSDYSAARRAYEHRATGYTSKTDWYLPSKDESNLACKVRYNYVIADVLNNSILCEPAGRTRRSGMIVPSGWTSTEVSATQAWRLDVVSGFLTSSKNAGSMVSLYIRAFSTP